MTIHGVIDTRVEDVCGVIVAGLCCSVFVDMYSVHTYKSTSFEETAVAVYPWFSLYSTDSDLANKKHV